jgi:hypothetical protein
VQKRAEKRVSALFCTFRKQFAKRAREKVYHLGRSRPVDTTFFVRSWFRAFLALSLSVYLPVVVSNLILTN